SATVRVSEAVALLGAAPEQAYDIVFLDPPFDADLWSAAAQALEGNGWLAASAWIYVEMPADAAPELPATWLPHREARAGAVRYALYRRSAKL
ncbi:MAG TPA: RsmD family RNA methyltransferase, partial [Rudaea sp.]